MRGRIRGSLFVNGLKLLIVAASAAAALAVSLGGAHAGAGRPLLQADSGGAQHQGS
jgi:hypothetical protein